MNLSAQIIIFKNVSPLDVMLFTKHLAVMVKAGISIPEALTTLSEQISSPYFRKVISEISDDIKNGNALSKALQKHPKVFSNFYVSLVEVSEKSGTLEQNLEFMANYLGKDYALRQKIKGALVYPGLVVSAATIMSGFIALFVLPQLVSFFEALEIELPLTTRILLAVANVMKNYGVVIVAGLAAFVASFVAFINLEPIKIYWDAFVLRLPLIGKLLKNVELAKFSRNLGVLLRSGVPMSTCLEVTASTLSNRVFKKHVLELNHSLQKGKSVGDALRKHNFSEFPSLVPRMISAGEETGKVEEIMLYLGDFFEDEIDQTSKNLTTILEPVLLLGIGLMVGFVALAIITPIYELTGSIRR